MHATNAGKNLIVTTSTGRLGDTTGPNIALNHLFVLELNATSKNLDVRAKTADFGKFESIKAIRYIGDKAYVVTFKNTDPLFAFDLSNLSEPKILSGLKIPGFSTYMHPLADGRLLGVGFDALDLGSRAAIQGIQVSLFDVSNPLELSRIDNHIYGTAGSSSEVTGDHHAFFYDEASKLIGLPLVERSAAKDVYSYSKVTFSGALMLSFQGDKLVEAGRISHTDLMPKECITSIANGYSGQNLDVNRIYRLDNRLITVSQFGVKAHALTDLNTPAVTTQFDKPASSACRTIYPYWD